MISNEETVHETFAKAACHLWIHWTATESYGIKL